MTESATSQPSNNSMHSFQVLWPTDGEYRTEALAVTSIEEKRWRKLTLTLPPQAAHTVLRVDPCASTGLILIKEIRISLLDDRKQGFTISTDKQDKLRLDQMVLTESSRCLAMVSVGGDPKCFLPPLPEHLTGVRLRFSIWIKLDSSSEQSLKSLASVVGKITEAQHLESRVKWLQENLETERSQTTDLQGKIKELSHLDAALQEARKTMETQAHTLSFLNAELGHVRKDLDWTRNEMDRHRKENDRRKIALRAAENTVHFKWTLPSFLLKKKQGKTVEVSGFEFNLEAPKSFNLPSNAVTLFGWCFAKSGEYIQAIRATVGDQQYEGSYGKRRFDVHTVFPNYHNSDRSGFEVELTDLPSRFTLKLEVLDDSNVWHTLKTVDGRVTSSLWNLDLKKQTETPLLKQITEITPKDQRVLDKELQSMTSKPLVSVIMPVYNTPADYLRAAIKSVKDQIYPHWQLCMADDGSTNAATLSVLKEAAASDSRIILHTCASNGGIAAASNAALDVATGDVMVLMDHDDVITPVALMRVAQVYINQGADFIYSDEAYITPDGDLLSTIYRPAFSLAYLRSHPYIVHLVAFSAALIRRLGGFKESLTISQDYDLILRAAESANCIAHIPEILYLWRQVPSSAGHTLQEKVMEISTSILSDHMTRSGTPCKVVAGAGFNFFKLRPTLDLSKCGTSIIIPTKNQAALLRRTVESLEATLPEGLPYRIVIVDHQSDDPETLDLLAGYKERHVMVSFTGPFNYAALNNFGVRHGAGDSEFLLLCNNDIELTEPQWIETLLECAADEKVGAVAPMMLYPDRETIQHAGVCVGLFGVAEHLGKLMASRDLAGTRLSGHQGMLWATREVSAITTACALFRRRAFEAVGGFNEELQIGFNDTDLCLRLWQHGYRVLYCGETSIIHHESASRGKSHGHDPHPADSRRFLETWGWLISNGDPFHNPNYSNRSTAWETAPLPRRTAKPQVRRYTNPASMFTK